MNVDKLQHVDILLVEDSPADVLITQEAFKVAKMVNTLHVVEDGEQALAFLHKEGKYSKAPRPGLILLDLNLPRKNGYEVLEEIKLDPELKTIPVIILTTSHAEKDVFNAYALHANCYIIKPVGFENFLQAAQSINDFWFSLVSLPEK